MKTAWRLNMQHEWYPGQSPVECAEESASIKASLDLVEKPQELKTMPPEVFSWKGSPTTRREVIDFFEEGLGSMTETELVSVLCGSSCYLLEYKFAAARMIGLESDREEWSGPRLQSAVYTYRKHVVTLDVSAG